MTKMRRLLCFSSLVLASCLIACYPVGAKEQRIPSHHDSIDTVDRRLSVAPIDGRYKRDVPETNRSQDEHTATTSERPRPAAAPAVPTKRVQWILNKPTKKPSTNQNAKTVTPPASVVFQPRDVSYFLESHKAISINDPRAYFTEERTSRSMAIMLHELRSIPSRFRFAFMVRIFEELGRKIVSKLNLYTREIVAILKKAPDGLGAKPDVSMYVDAVTRAFESKEDRDPYAESEAAYDSTPISPYLKTDKEKEALFNASLSDISIKFAHIVSHFLITAEKSNLIQIRQHQDDAVDLLANSLRAGALTMIFDTSSSDKFRIPEEVTRYMSDIIRNTIIVLKRHVRDMVADNQVDDSTASDSSRTTQTNSYSDLNQISDKTGLIGPWNTFLFSNLGCSERVIKLFASLLARVPTEFKSRWINMYIEQVKMQLDATLTSFVALQGMPHYDGSSESYLLNSSSRSSKASRFLKPRAEFANDKNRIPARCYLAGRRWRLALLRATREYKDKDLVIGNIVEKVTELKIKSIHDTGNDMNRLCLPRLEVGLKGWSINGDPNGDLGTQSSDFPLKHPIEGLNEEDPFTRGVKFGYQVGFKLGFNEKRNASLEMELAHDGIAREPNKKLEEEMNYLSRAIYRKASTMGAKRAFEKAIHEGYLTTLKISLRAGMLIPMEAATKLAALRGFNYGGQAGQHAGRLVANKYLVGKDIKERMRDKLVKLGESQGLLAGQVMGETIGALAGKEAAAEAFKRAINRGGKLSRAKFHMDAFKSGAKYGLDFGIEQGERVASSSSLDPLAPTMLRFPKLAHSIGNNNNQEQTVVDHWEKDLMPPLTLKQLYSLHTLNNHTLIHGTMEGSYKFSREIKKSLRRVSFTNVTYNLEVTANGYIKNGIAYLTLDGRINNQNVLHGSLVARDIFNEDQY